VTISTWKEKQTFPVHGWIGLVLAVVFWVLNWTLPGLRTFWGFFPMWLGYCLTIDGLVYYRTGTSLLFRDWRKYILLFLISAPSWWLFEAFNLRLQNWHYRGAEFYTPLQFTFWSTLSFTTVLPAVFGSAELISSFGFLKRVGRGPIIRPDRKTTLIFFCSGWVMLGLMWIWPKIFFPFVWISVYFILEPVNVWMGNRSLADYTSQGNWRPVLALWLGILLTAFFWEMWNFFSYPKWIYLVPWGGCCHIFEMPLLGYGGYLPFSLELFALYHLVMGLFGVKKQDYVLLAE
jgi:hypothetical protein